MELIGFTSKKFSDDDDDDDDDDDGCMEEEEEEEETDCRASFSVGVCTIFDWTAFSTADISA